MNADGSNHEPTHELTDDEIERAAEAVRAGESVIARRD